MQTIIEFLKASSKSYLKDLDGLMDFLKTNSFVHFKDIDTSDDYSMLGNMIDMGSKGYVTRKLGKTSEVFLVIPDNRLFAMNFKVRDLFSCFEWEWRRGLPVIVTQDTSDILDKIEKLGKD